MRPFRSLILNALLLLSVLGPVRAEIAAPAASESIVFIGNGLGERMIDHPYLEARLLHRFSQQHLVLRNLCRPGDTAGFRPHPSRKTQWAFPGAEKFHPQHGVHAGEGTYPTPDEWLTTLKADTVMAFFGYNESFDGKAGLERFKGELTALIAHTAAQNYNGKGAPRLILVSPIAYEDLTKSRSLPNGKLENVNLQLYTQAMAEVAAANKTLFVDLYTPTLATYPNLTQPFTRNGFLPTDEGYKTLSKILIESIYGLPTSASALIFIHKSADFHLNRLRDFSEK